jgi:hypothetical protein
MKSILESAVQDLREKRLWPLAVLLLLALVAIPVLLIQPAKQPGPVSDAPAKQKLPALTAISDAARAGEGSGLGVFNKADPFLPPEAIVAATRAQSSTAGATTAAGSPAGAAGASSGSSSSPSSGSGSSSSSGSGGGSSGGGSSAPTTGGGRSGGGSHGGGGAKTVNYTYVADVTFTRDGHTRHIHGMTRLSMLPSESSPLLLFLGVDSSADNAVFLVDSTLDASGEGSCSPSERSCGVLSLGAGSIERFSGADGHSYTLEVDEIRKVRVSGGGAKASRRTRSAHASSAPGRRFEVPALTDLMTVARPAGQPSSSDRDRR